MSHITPTQVHADPDIFKIYVPLPGNPLKNLNCYVLRTPDKSLIIDTGFNIPESKEALLMGISDLKIDMRKTEIYATHLHADHTGLIGEIMLDDTVIHMSKQDYEIMVNMMSIGWETLENNMIQEGFPRTEVKENRMINPARSYVTRKIFTPSFAYDGDHIRIGPYTLTVISVPGHTPGNTCLYLEAEKILFTGDHILFDITPNICSWPGMEDALGCYLESLKKIRALDIRLALPAHRSSAGNAYERIDQLLAHHNERLQNTADIIRACPGATAYDIASHMRWSMRGKDWTEFPVQQKWFAVGETCSHLDYLIKQSIAEKKMMDSIYRYYLL